MSQQSIINTFEQGMGLDDHVYQVPKGIYTYGENLTFITHAGNELILQNEKGTTQVGQLKENYILIASKSYNGIAYLISAEVNPDGKLTGRGEIGTFPSPDYANTVQDCSTGTCYQSGNIIETYSPLRNYLGDATDPSIAVTEDYDQEFNSIYFNFSTDWPVEIVAVQPSYDGTVNIIFTDWNNPARLVNSRFSVLPDNRFRIIDRVGSNDENIYDRTSFASKLNHILATDKPVVASFLGQETGGQLVVGTYRYYLRYATQDGNATDIVAHTFNIPVAFGDSLKEMKGGLINERTNFANRLLFEGLDTTFSFVRLYFAYSVGVEGSPATVQVFEIENLYNITGESMEILHTGFENSSNVPVTDIALTNANIFTYRTGVEVQGRLLIGNTKQRQFSSTALRDFAANITTGHTVKRMQVLGTDTDVNMSDIFTDIPKNNRVGDAYAGGYANARNVHDYLGYWRGESYMSGIVFLLKGGGTSQVFPVRGIDELTTIVNHVYPNANLDFYSDANENLQQYLTSTGENVRGVYRFPVDVPFFDNGLVNILGMTFKIPEIPDQVKKDTVGAFFVRAERKRDCIGQGNLNTTIPIPISDYLEDGNERFFLYDFERNRTKFIPAYRMVLESLSRHGVRNGDIRGSRMATEDKQGIDPVLFNPYSAGFSGKWYSSTDVVADQPSHYWWKKKFALFNPEIASNRAQATNVFNGKRYMRLMAKVKSMFAIKTKRGATNGDGLTADQLNTGHFSVVKTTDALPYGTGTRLFETDLDFVNEFNQVPNATGFASKCEFWAPFTSSYETEDIIIDGASGDYTADLNVQYANFPLEFNGYVGVTAETRVEPFPDQPNPEVGQINHAGNPWDSWGNHTNQSGCFLDSLETNDFTKRQNVFDEGSMIVNFYPQEGPRSNSINKEIHFPQFEQYYPITQPFYWDDTARANSGGSARTLQDILVDGVVEAWNGDNFINLHYHRVFYNGLSRLVVDNRLVERSIDVGYTVAYLAESNINTSFRHDQILNVTEGNRSFLPHYATTEPGTKLGNTWRQQRLPESQALNSGYNDTKSERYRVGLDLTLPFTIDLYDTRIMASNIYITNAFENGYRVFAADSFKDYSKHMGELVKLCNLNGNLLAVFERGVVLLPLGQRLGGVSDSAGEVFFESQGLLPPPNAVNYVSEKFGSRWQYSVVTTDNTVYGVDIDRKKIWRVSGNGLELISDFKVQSFLRSLTGFENKKEQALGIQLRGYHDTLLHDVIWTFHLPSTCGEQRIDRPTVVPVMSIEGETVSYTGGIPRSSVTYDVLCYPEPKCLVYNELPLGQWKTFRTYHAHQMFTINDRLFSLPLNSPRHTIHEHYKGAYQTYYGELKPFKISFVATLSTAYHQFYNNLKVISNQVYPATIEYETEAGTFVQTIRPRNVVATPSQPYFQPPVNNMWSYNAVYKEDHMYVTVIKDASDLHTLTNYINRRIRDKYCKITVTYLTDQPLFIQAVETLATISFS